MVLTTVLYLSLVLMTALPVQTTFFLPYDMPHNFC